MSGSPEVLSAIRELTTSKQLDRAELLDLLRDGIHAALARRYGPNVRFELEFDELKGAIKVVRLRQVVEVVEDASAQIALEEAQYEDPDFAIGDMLEEASGHHYEAPRVLVLDDAVTRLFADGSILELTHNIIHVQSDEAAEE
ncbi:MAG TPA: NusA N-terminal domain-containing protein, partial [Gemmatimonadales bacterium]|nr:NusA N-terminal domain-containing protein [Gemmatimonadales bacterium]